MDFRVLKGKCGFLDCAKPERRFQYEYYHYKTACYPNTKEYVAGYGWCLLTSIPVLKKGKLCKLSNQVKSFGNLVRRKGTKGTANNPSSRNHRLYCIRLDRMFLKIFLTIRRRTMIPLINKFDMKKRIIK